MTIIYQDDSDADKINYINSIMECFNVVRKVHGRIDSPEKKVMVWAEMNARAIFPEPEVREIIKEVEKPLISSEQKLEYMRWYNMRKKQERIEQDKQKKLQLKTDRVKSRVNRLCLRCFKKIVVADGKIEFKTKRNGKKVIHFVGTCPKCQSANRWWGGYA